MSETSTEAPAGSQPDPNATPAGAFAYFTGPDGSIAWLDVPASYDEEAIGFLRTNAEDPATTLRFTEPKAWAAECDRRGLTETPVPTNEDPAAPMPEAEVVEE
jgi:hypothetical protein